jgi:formiminotetrahydrofolate cyclodeaminase
MNDAILAAIPPGNHIGALSLAQLAAAVAGDAPTPGGGAVAAGVASLAAALVGMAGRYAARPAEQPVANAELVARADQLRIECLRLADDDARAYGRYVEAAALPRQPDPAGRTAAIHAALGAAADVPLQLGRLAAQIADFGEELTRSGNPNLRSDACTAALLADAVAASAAIFVSVNIRERRDDPRLLEARNHAAAAASAARRASALLDNTEERTTP